MTKENMTLEAIFQNFMVDQDFDSKHGSVAVMVLLFPLMKSFLEDNPGVTNHLSCIVRSFLNVKYFRPAFAVLGALESHLVEPFYSVTIATRTTHSQLKSFYKTLFQEMSKDVTSDFFRRRRGYEITSDFEEKYLAKQQAFNEYDTPVINIAMERLCGQSKLSFRSFCEEACQVKNLKLTWIQSMKEKFQAGVAVKQVIAVMKERKRLNMTAELKEGGPFTNSYKVEEHVKSDITETKNQKKMKKEILFARGSSTYLPKSDPLFRIQVTLPNKIRRDVKTSLKQYFIKSNTWTVLNKSVISHYGTISGIIHSLT
ncbi:hypothetical protein HELRODRAFT_178627 [Helobdella robusta]|uniref:Uncharacterized protein n=1 Tax=Helobdella robusta TaxID=6412 RepID=T1FDH0_HELRO|nr:hypothetical protein HELRODRAFT_178627 [Helobdella robusta]ESN96830.1 hypothetical protein HELRODRAFT_178627 [Helobdella robusta]